MARSKGSFGNCCARWRVARTSLDHPGVASRPAHSPRWAGRLLMMPDLGLPAGSGSERRCSVAMDGPHGPNFGYPWPDPARRSADGGGAVHRTTGA